MALPLFLKLLHFCFCNQRSSGQYVARPNDITTSQHDQTTARPVHPTTPHDPTDRVDTGIGIGHWHRRRTRAQGWEAKRARGHDYRTRAHVVREEEVGITFASAVATAYSSSVRPEAHAPLSPSPRCGGPISELDRTVLGNSSEGPTALMTVGRKGRDTITPRSVGVDGGLVATPLLCVLQTEESTE